MRAPWHLLLPFGLVLQAAPAHAELRLEAVEAYQTADLVLLNLELAIDDPEAKVARMLLRGDVWLEVEVALRHERPWLEDRRLGQFRLLRRLSYDPQAPAYWVADAHSGERQSFARLERALEHLLHLRAVPAVRLDSPPNKPEEYRGESAARLYANAIPIAPGRGLDWHSRTVRWSLP